jgi:hypothetical protein
LTEALSQAAHDGSRWSHLFLRSRQRLQALTLRNDEAADVVGAVGEGEGGLTDAIDDAEGEGRSTSRDSSSNGRLMPLIRARAHGNSSQVVVVCREPAAGVARTTLAVRWD